MGFLCNCLVKLAKNGSDESDISVETDSQGLLPPSGLELYPLLMWSFQSIQSLAFNFHVPSRTKATLRVYQDL